ncbi:MAG: hypothetical protein EPN47_16680 [Acidobacteria bacterium]|nr:MAG: hypothetical protein EPN47_16680 [Acidobacteriota bacterium]
MQGNLSHLLSMLNSSGKRSHLFSVAGGFVILVASVFVISCGGSSSNNTAPPPVPSILNINSSTNPSSPINLPIEINGSGFQGSPGSVVFTQASSGITATVTPSAGGWTDTGIAVTVPAGNGTNNFTLPGTVTVAVKTSGGTSNTVDVTLIQTLTFDVNNVQWTNAATLPKALTGLRAAAIPVTDTTAYVVTTGGFDGTGNTSSVFVGALDPTGNISAWTTSSNILPETIAHHGMVEANSGNSLVPTGSAYIYVIGGQVNSADAPGGTTNVYNASFDHTTGTVGAWTTLSSSLPETLVGPAVTLFNGYVYVIGGLHSDGTPSADVFSVPVNKDGTLGTWTKSTSAYPMGISFATAFGFAGRLYVLGGDSASSTGPNQQGNPGVNNVNFATALNGVVGTWTATSSTIKKRKKQITWNAFGQVIDAEGVYDGLPGSLELERSQINPDSTLASWNGITSTTNKPNANVYNAAAIVSPLQSPTSTPRFMLIGGQSAVTGVISNTVYYNNAP